MSYYFTKTIPRGFEDAIAKVREELDREGFGILTNVDIQAAFKKTIGADFRRYQILGACNPKLALKALQTESWIGTMLPCNLIVQEHETGQVEVSAINPLESMKAVANPDLWHIGQQVAEKLQRVLDRI